MLKILFLTFFLQVLSISDSSVAISVQGNGYTGYGTGTVIANQGNKSLIITNAHVVPDDTNPVFISYLYEGKWYKQEGTYLAGSKVTKTDQTTIEINGPDLAIIELECKLVPVKFAKEIPKVNSYVKMYGFTGNLTQWTLREGKVIPNDFLGKYTKSTLPQLNGDSGSGVFNENDELVAVFWGGAAMRLDAVKEFLVTELRKKKKFTKLILELKDDN